MSSTDPQPPLQPRVVRLRLRRRARHARLVLGRAGLAGVAAASLVAVPAITLRPRQGALTQESVVLAAPAGAPWPGAGQGTGMFLPVADPGCGPTSRARARRLRPAAGSDAAGLGAAVPRAAGRAALSRGIPSLVLDAYRRAAGSLQGTDPGCGLPWWLLAGIGRIESGQASGGRVDAAGTTRGMILGPRLDGSVAGTAVIRDTDGGALDLDPTYDRAVGPMQFLPGTWRSVRLRRQRRRALRPAQRVRRRARGGPLPVRLRRRPAHAHRAGHGGPELQLLDVLPERRAGLGPGLPRRRVVHRAVHRLGAAPAAGATGAHGEHRAAGVLAATRTEPQRAADQRRRRPRPAPPTSAADPRQPCRPRRAADRAADVGADRPPRRRPRPRRRPSRRRRPRRAPTDGAHDDRAADHDGSADDRARRPRPPSPPTTAPRPTTAPPTTTALPPTTVPPTTAPHHAVPTTHRPRARCRPGTRRPRCRRRRAASRQAVRPGAVPAGGARSHGAGRPSAGRCTRHRRPRAGVGPQLRVDTSSDPVSAGEADRQPQHRGAGRAALSPTRLAPR